MPFAKLTDATTHMAFAGDGKLRHIWKHTPQPRSQPANALPCFARIFQPLLYARMCSCCLQATKACRMHPEASAWNPG